MHRSSLRPFFGLLLLSSGELLGCGGSSVASPQSAPPVNAPPAATREQAGPTDTSAAVRQTTDDAARVEACRSLVEQAQACGEQYARTPEDPYRPTEAIEDLNQHYHRLGLCRDEAGDLVAATYAHTSSSDDWHLAGHYCFRADGSLLSYEETYNTQYGQVTVHVRTEFDAAGRLSHSTEEVRDWASGEITDAEFGRFFDTPVYRTREALEAELELPPKSCRPSGKG